MTSFPQPLGLAAAFDREMLHEVASLIAEEMRAASNLYRRADKSARFAWPFFNLSSSKPITAYRSGVVLRKDWSGLSSMQANMV